MKWHRRCQAGKMKLSAISVAIAVGVVGVVLVGCGSSSSGDSKYSMVMIPPVAGDDFAYTSAVGAEEAAEKHGVDLEVQYPSKFDAGVQVELMNAAIAKNPDAIILDPDDAHALQAPVEEAVNRGIKVVIYDARIADLDVATSYISSDVPKAGEAVATEMANLMKKTGSISYVDAAPGETFFEELREGFESKISSYEQIEVLPVQYYNFEETKANSIMRTTLTTEPELAGAFAITAPAIAGVMAALKESDKLDQVNFVAFDGYQANIEALETGELKSVVSTETQRYGSDSVDVAVKALEGEEVPARITPPICVMTKENVHKPENAGCIYKQAPQ